jgi:hypothetical protein
MLGLKLIELEDLSDEIPDEAYHLIGQVITAWSALDRTVLELLVAALGVDVAAAGILIGRMDTRGKLDRLIAIHEYRNERRKAAALRELAKRIKILQGRRNDLAHGELLGTHKKSKELLFLVIGYSRDEDEDEPILHVHGYSLDALKDNLKQINARTKALHLLASGNS